MNPSSLEEVNETAIPAIRAIAHETWRPTYGAILSQTQMAFMLDWMYSEASLQQQFREGCRFLVLRYGTRPVGFAGFQVSGKGHKLHKLYVLPETQGKGAGRTLLAAVSQRASEAGGTYMDLNVNRHNAARSFYEKMGFTVLRTEDNYIGNGYWMNDFVMRLML